MLKIKFTYLKILWMIMVISCSISIYSQMDKTINTSVNFVKVQLTDKYLSEGASIWDVDNDGSPDIIAGPIWWKGPKFKNLSTYDSVPNYNLTDTQIADYASHFFSFPAFLNDDGWTDILNIGVPGSDSRVIYNPGIQKETSIKNNKTQILPAIEKVGNESPLFTDIIDNDRPELIAFCNGQLIIGIAPNHGEPWTVLPISPKDVQRFDIYKHGLGCGDINGDGLKDIVENSGWWEQPANWDRKTYWKHHSFHFSKQTGGAQMLVYDVNGDNKNDIITAMNAHGYGLSWFEQVESSEGQSPDFKKHIILPENPEGNTEGLNFSQLHSLAMADIDNDGVRDIITGKCFFAHNGKDPGALDPAVLYWFRIVRSGDGKVEIIPHLIDNDSGIGRQIGTGDLNGDGKEDIVTANKKGVHIFLQK